MTIELNQQVRAMIEFIHSLSPQVRVEHTNIIYQDEHANLKVYPPLTWDEEQCLDLEEQIAERVVDVLVDSGYLILAHVYTLEEQIAQARRELAETERRKVKVGRFLAQAAALGLA